MSRQAQAEREKQARVILGSAEAAIAGKFVEAAAIYAGPLAFVSTSGANTPVGYLTITNTPKGTAVLAGTLAYRAFVPAVVVYEGKRADKALSPASARSQVCSAWERRRSKNSLIV